MTDLPMPSDKGNSIMAIATGLISSLFNVVSSRDVPFCQLQLLQCLHHTCSSTETYIVTLFSISFSTAAWQFAKCALWLQQCSQVCFLHYSLNTIWPKVVEVAGNNHDISRLWHIHLLNWELGCVCPSTCNWAFCIFCTGWIDCGDTFRAFLLTLYNELVIIL